MRAPRIQAATAQMRWVENHIVECQPLSGALPLSLTLRVPWSQSITTVSEQPCGIPIRASWISAVGMTSGAASALPSESLAVGCDIHTGAHAKDGLYNISV